MTTSKHEGPVAGQDHYQAKNTDREIEMARALHEGGMRYARIA